MDERNASGASIVRQLKRLLALSKPRSRDDFLQLARLTEALADQDVSRGGDWTDKDTGELAALLAEYESIRSESMQTIGNRTQIMMLGLAAMGALIGGALTIEKPDTAPARLLITAIFSGAVPLVFTFVFLVWLSEAVRAHRAGYFLASDVEARINAKLGRLVTTWETSLWTARLPRDELFGPSMMAIMVLAVVACLAPPFGMILCGKPFRLSWEAGTLLGGPYLLFALTAGYARGNLSRLKNAPVLLSALSEARAGSASSN
ncbi:MAG: hypothetical protein ACYDIE_01405 [Candidatus Krumholzibacteriia bacterium]